MSTTVSSSFHWKCRHTWQRSAKNTLWCLLGCSIGDFGTILFFQLSNISWPTLNIMVLAIINGLITSIALETIILFRQMNIKQAFLLSNVLLNIALLNITLLNIKIITFSKG